MPYPSGYGVAVRNRYAGTIRTPRGQIGTLMNAGYILALNDKGAACQAIVASARDLSQEVRRAGGDAQARRSLVDWRRERLQAALPVGDWDGRIRMGRVVNADVRNAQGDDLGDVDDVIMGPKGEKIAYVLVGRGGYLGIDEEHVAVPWQHMKVVPVPYRDLLVLDVDESVMDRAPTLSIEDAERMLDEAEWTRKVDSYWREQATG